MLLLLHSRQCIQSGFPSRRLTSMCMNLKVTRDFHIQEEVFIGLLATKIFAPVKLQDKKRDY